MRGRSWEEGREAALSRNARIGLATVLVGALLLVLSPGKSKAPTFLGTPYHLLFQRVEGLRKGDRVTVAGVDSGRVAAVEFSSEEERRRFGSDAAVRVTVVMERSVVLPRDSRYSVRSNLKGERWIDIIPGRSSERLASGDTVRNEGSTLSSDQLTRSFQSFRSLSRQVGELQGMMTDPEFRRKVKEVASDLRFYSREFLKASEGVSGRVARMGRRMGAEEQRILARLEAVDGKVTELRHRMAELIAQLTGQLGRWRQLLQGAESELAAGLAGMVELSEQFRAQAAEWEEQSGRVDAREVLTALRGWSRRLQDWADLAEDLQAIVGSPEAQEELRGLVEQLRAQTEKLKADAERWEGYLKSIP